MKDRFGNEVKYTLEEGKTTLRGEHRKFKEDKDCAFPERLDCNSGPMYERCRYMKFVSLGVWRCTYEKDNHPIQ